MLMAVMQFRQVGVIVGEGRVVMGVCMWLLARFLSLMPVIVMRFVMMEVVVF